MYVPYTEILVSHLHFVTSVFSSRFNLQPKYQRYVDTRENMETQGESGMD